MLSHRIALAAPLLVACTSRAQVAEEMTDALLRANEALGVALVATEPAGYAVDPLWALDDGYRHPASGPCPSNEHDSEDLVSFHASLGYGDGCLPRSGLVPTIVSGDMGMDVEGAAFDATYDGMSLALAHPVLGAASGEVVVLGGVDEELVLAADLEVRGTDATLEAEVDLGALLSPDDVTLDGPVVVDGVEIVLSGVVLRYADILGECPKPRAGIATVAGPTAELVVDFADPGDGTVTVTREGRVSDPADLCAFDSWIFSG